MSKTTISLVLYKWKELSNGDHPFMIRITQDSKRTYFSIKESCSPKYWDFKKDKLKTTHPDYESLNEILKKREEAFNKARKELSADKEHFTPDELIEKVNRPIKSGTVINLIDTIIKEKTDAGKIGYARVFKDTRRVLKLFLNGKKDVSFLRINGSWLESFEAFLIEGKMSEVTISVYFRTLRLVYNQAIKLNYVRIEHYPFRDFKVSKFNIETPKIAISKEEMTAIKNLDLSQFPEAEIARKYFLFSFYGRGINFIDIAKLTGENIKSGRIKYIRSKTGKEVNFKDDRAMEIINDFCPSRSLNRKDYLFPILDSQLHITPTQIYNRYHKIMSQVNDGLKIVAKLAKISEDLTFYVARHTYASICINNGVTSFEIQKSMGHASLNTTEIYLKHFQSDKSDQVTYEATAI